MAPGRVQPAVNQRGWPWRREGIICIGKLYLPAPQIKKAGVVATLADIIVTANAAPAQALASVRLAIAEEGCVFDQTVWNRWGCAGMSSVASSIERAIGSGPAATVGQGGVAVPPPTTGTGSGGADYRSPIGG